MNKYLKLYLKIFLQTGIPSGIVMGIFLSLKNEFHEGLLYGLYGGISFGFLMSITLGFDHIRAVKRMTYGISEETLGVNHIRNIELQLAYDEALDLCVASLNLIKKCNVRKKDCPSGKIIAKTSMTWKTWGDVISFDVRKIDSDKTGVEVSSRPLLRTTIIDFGRNLENVEKIVAFLRKHAMV